MRKIWRPIIILALLTSLAGSAAAQEEDGLSMTVSAGFDGYCREESWCPILIFLTNEGTDIEGELRIALPGSVNTPDDTFVREVTLPVHSRKAYFLYIPFPSSALRFNVQLVEQRRVLASQAVALRELDAQDRLYAIVSSDPSALNFLSDIPIGQRAVVTHFELESLPGESIGWEAIDALVLNDVDTTTLRADQREALETWLSHGGHLIVGGGAGAARTAAGVSDLLPVTIGGLETIDTLDALGQVVAGPFPVVETTLQSGEVLIEQDGLPLIARRSLGGGTIDFLAFDAGLDPFIQPEGQLEFWRTVVGIAARGIDHIALRDTYNARRAIASIPGLRAPSILQIIAFLFAYIILIGPINYLALRKLKRREWAWLTIPLIVIGFTGCAYVTGFQIRGRTPIIHRLGLVYTPENGSSGYATELVGLFSPRRSTYDLQLEDGGISRISDNSYMYGSYNEMDPPEMVILQEGRTSTVTDFRVNVGDIYALVANGYVESTSPEFDLEVNTTSGTNATITGRIQNGAMALEDAILVFGLNRVSLGDLTPGQIITNFEDVETVSSAGSLYPDSILLPWIGNLEIQRREHLVEAFFPSSGSNIPAGIYLVGWNETAPLDVHLASGNARTSDVALHIFELSAETQVGESAFIPASLINRSLETSTGYVEVTNGQIFISSGSTAVFHYSVWSGAAVNQATELTLTLAPVDYATDTPEVALWNWETEEWERQQIILGENVITEAGNYFDPEGGVRVQLEASSTQYTELKDLSISIRGQQ